MNCSQRKLGMQWRRIQSDEVMKEKYSKGGVTFNFVQTAAAIELKWRFFFITIKDEIIYVYVIYQIYGYSLDC